MSRKLNDGRMTIRQPPISVSNQVFTSLATLDLLPAFETLGSDRYPLSTFSSLYVFGVGHDPTNPPCVHLSSNSDEEEMTLFTK